VISPKWGLRIRLETIITNAELEYDQPLRKNPCLTNECEECIKICPVHALDEWKGNTIQEGDVSSTRENATNISSQHLKVKNADYA